ncbi:MAG: restriction endonuclease subunit R, partial [Planctomycetes bacterium]|nr:restriction endonuclease subunit R [Planctomycetota bacterium]
EGLVGEATAGRGTDAETGLDEVQGPFYDLLLEEVTVKDKPAPEKLATLRGLTVAMVEHVRSEVGIVGFWTRNVAQTALRSWIVRTLDDASVLPFDRLDAVADRLMELARANHDRLVQ